MIGLKDMKFEKENEILGAVASSLIERKEGMCLTDEEFALFIAFLTFTLFVYQKPEDITGERLRGANLVTLKQLDMTSSLLKIVRAGNEERFINEIIKELPPNLKVSRVIIEDIKNLKESKQGDKIIIILYNDGSLKVKRGE